MVTSRRRQEDRAGGRDHRPSPTYSNAVGFDDAPFDHRHRGDVPVVGAVFAGLRFDGVVVGKVRRDGANAARNLAALIRGSRFRQHLQLVMLHGIALAGFNVVDIAALHRDLGLPVLVVCRRQPNLGAIREALLTRVRGGQRKWALIERLQPMRPVESVWVQSAGLPPRAAGSIIRRFAAHGHLPEPLRAAHLIAGAMVTGQSRGRA